MHQPDGPGAAEPVLGFLNGRREAERRIHPGGDHRGAVFVEADEPVWGSALMTREGTGEERLDGQCGADWNIAWVTMDSAGSGQVLPEKSGASGMRASSASFRSPAPSLRFDEVFSPICFR